VSPDFAGRTDVDKYNSSVAELENFIVHAEGGVHKRSGSTYLNDCINVNAGARLVPFISSTDEAYILEFNKANQANFRVYKDGARQMVNTNRVVDAVDITTDEFSFVDHGYIDGQGPYHITITGVIPIPLAVDTDYYISLPKEAVFVDGAVTVHATNPAVFTVPLHGYSDQMGPFRLTTDPTGLIPLDVGALPTGLSANVDYYIVYVSTSTFQLSLTPGGAGVAVTGATGGGYHSLQATGDYRRDKFRLSTSAFGDAINITNAGTAPHTITPNPVGSPSGIILEVPHSLLASSVNDFQYVQKADILFLDDKEVFPRQIARLGDAQWSVDRQNIFDGPYLDENTESTSLIAASATTGTNINLTLSGTILVNGGVGWRASDIGRQVRLKPNASLPWGFAEITGIVSSTVARATVRAPIGNTSTTATYRIGVWYTGNQPRSLSFSGQRLWHGGEASAPQTIHGSQTAKFTSFGPTDLSNAGVVLDSSATNFEFSSNLAEPIKWMGVQNQLFIGTASSIITVRASLDNEAVTPTNVFAPQLTAIGASSLRPLAINDQLLYISRNSQKLHAISSDTERERVGPADITLLARQVFGYTNTVIESVYQQHRNQVAWFVLSDGTLAAVTYVPEQNLFAWHTHKLGGSFSTGDAMVESIAVIPSVNGSYDTVWMIVKRTVNSLTTRHLEYFEDEWLDGVATNMRFLDSAVVYSSTTTTTMSGLDHLEGQTVDVLAGGAKHPDRTVASGSITLDDSYTDVVAGLSYTSRLKTLPLEVADPEGGSMGKVARIDHLVLRLYNSFGGTVGPDATNQDPLIFRSGDDEMDEQVPTFTGDKKVSFAGPFRRRKEVVIEHSDPTAFNVLAINVFLSSGQR